jgi:hypothetical protein
LSRPGVVAGLVGVGVAMVVVIGFELILAVQALVFLLALPMGLLIGWYAVEREQRAPAASVVAGSAATAAGAAPTSAGRIGWGRALGSGLVAGLITGLSLAVLYVLIRLLFLYLDNGFRAGGPAYACTLGPECGYQRALDEPSLRAALDEAGVHDAAGYTAYFLESQALGGAALLVLVLGGSLAGAAAHRAASSGATSSTIAPEGTL